MRVVHFTLVKPFDVSPKCGGVDETCTVEEIWDTRRHKRYLELAKNGDFKEEFKWWESAYDGMMASIKTDNCNPTER